MPAIRTSASRALAGLAFSGAAVALGVLLSRAASLGKTIVPRLMPALFGTSGAG